MTYEVRILNSPTANPRIPFVVKACLLDLPDQPEPWDHDYCSSRAVALVHMQKNGKWRWATYPADKELIIRELIAETLSLNGIAPGV